MLSRRLQSGWGVSIFSWYEVFVSLITILGEEGFVLGGENILVSAAKPGGNVSLGENVPEKILKPGQIPQRKENVPENAEIPGQTSPQKENVPESATKPGQTPTNTRKCPEKSHKTETNAQAHKEFPTKICITPQLSLLSRAQNFLRLYILFNPLVVN